MHPEFCQLLPGFRGGTIYEGDAHTHERLASMSESMDRRVLERSIGEDLAIRNFAPRLHLPVLAGVSQGLGFPNLSCLGLLSDRILTSYYVGSASH
ncbi:MAG: hypothetical protein NVS4B11_37760 [Ktedonobacteraceae bacterium]